MKSINLSTLFNSIINSTHCFFHLRRYTLGPFTRTHDTRTLEGFFFPFRRENFFLDLSFFPFLTFSLSLSNVSFHRSLSVPSCLFSFSFKIRSTFVFRSRPTPENDRVSLFCLFRFSFFVRPKTKRWKNYLFFFPFTCFSFIFSYRAFLFDTKSR